MGRGKKKKKRKEKKKKKTFTCKIPARKINWNRMAVSTGWWLPPVPSVPLSHPQLREGAQPSPVSDATAGPDPIYPPPPAPPAPPSRGEAAFWGEHLLVLKKFSEFQEHYVTLTRK